MADTFSFSDKPILAILSRIQGILPGIDQADALFYDAVQESLVSCRLTKHSGEYVKEISKVSDPTGLLNKYRLDSVPYSWIRKEDITFEFDTQEKVQLNIFNELDNNILLIRIHNIHDNLSDLIFIYFNKNLSNFGLVSNQSFLSTEGKTIVGHLIRNMTESWLSSIRSDREIFSSLVDHQNLVMEELAKVKVELTSSTSREKEAILLACRSILNGLSSETGIEFILSDDAVEKIKEFKGDPGSLSIVMSKAAKYARSVNIRETDKRVTIFGHHIAFLIPEKRAEIPPSTIIREEIPEVPVRYAKTFAFLNRLEAAAQSVKVRNQLLTSANVGGAFPSPITPAAITDALKNHQSKIVFLFKELPNRWQIIRSEFRPVQNILNPKPEKPRKTG